MNLLLAALRHPLSVMVALVGIVLGFVLAIGKPVSEQFRLPYPAGLPAGMEVDIFPALNLPVIYVCQPYGGMDPAQMEGYLTNYYEYHFLYISGIHHVESRNVQGVALMKLFFHPGTNMAQAMAETISYVNRSRAFMPPGTVSPFVMRFDTGSVPVGYLVLSSDTRSIAEINDLALFSVRPMFASLPGVSAPPPFGGSARTLVVTVDPQRLQSYKMSPDEVVNAITKSNIISPSGNVPIGDRYPIVPVNSIVKDAAQMATVPIRLGASPVYLRDIGTVADAADAPAGYALVNGRRAVYILATKRADASTLSVVNTIKRALPDMQAKLPADIRVSFELDQSPFVTRSVVGVLSEGVLGAVLVGLMILVFLWDWRSALVVVLNIPLALMGAVIALWITGYTINVMTLGGLALAIGILVDESTVEIENIHAQMTKSSSIARAVRQGNVVTAIPRLLAMLCILAVFVPAFFMPGAARALFMPLALAVGFSMIASYILSSTFVPVLSVWLLKHSHAPAGEGLFDGVRRGYERLVGGLVTIRWLLVPAYLAVCIAIIVVLGGRLGREIFPTADVAAFRLRLRAPDGTHIGKTEQLAKEALRLIGREVGPENVKLSLGYVGMIHSNFPINAVYQWSRGPEEAILYVSLADKLGHHTEAIKESLRKTFAQELPTVRCSFEPADIVNEVMSFGSPTPVEVSVSGSDFAASRAFATKIHDELARLPFIRDLQFGQSLDYPTIEVNVDRQKAGLAGLTAADVSRSLVTATSSSRFVVPNYWADPKSGIAYQVQVEIPRPVVRSVEGMDTIRSAGDIGQIPLMESSGRQVLIRDIAEIQEGKMPGQYDRYNMKRQVTLTANRAGIDLGTLTREVAAAIKRAGDPPAGTQVELRGQIPPLNEIASGLSVGLIISIIAIFLLLTANFQSVRLALVAVASAPAAVAGVVVILWLTGTTLNVQSFIGAIMAIGVAMANAILLVTFAELRRREGASAQEAAASGAGGRLRPVLMTSLAMVAGMLPMALAFGEAGAQNAPLGRAVIGGLAGGTLATLLVLPPVFTLFMRRASGKSPSLDPDDPTSAHYSPTTAGAAT
ncbi:MAG: efflux RND transporter permease subunit [Pirellulaceae bacterium]|nr:efflux RND transporter permease subunit [Pirellulaceae bacterium]